MGATFSTDGAYRYHLTRDFAPDLLSIPGPRAVFIMLNPSTADADTDDPTIRRCASFAADSGCSGLAVVNLYAYRATNPAELHAVSDPVGPLNDEYVAAALASAKAEGAPVVAAWGATAAPNVTARVEAVMAMRGADRVTALATTKDGHPRHPLYLPRTATPTPWR